MFGKKKRDHGDKIRAKAEKRLSKIPTGDVITWADMAGTGIAKALDDYRRQGQVLSLREAQEGASALAGAIDVLISRN